MNEALDNNKICVDMGMTIALLLLMAYELIGQSAHEWLGIGMFSLFVTHPILNHKWSGNLLKGRYTPLCIWQTLLVDEYCGPEPTQEAYNTLYALYEQQGLTEAEIDELLVLDIKEYSYFTDRGMRQNRADRYAAFFFHIPYSTNSAMYGRIIAVVGMQSQ